MRVAVTGAAGFVGSHLCERLIRDGCEVVGLDNFDGFYAPARKRRNLARLEEDDRFSFAELDLRDRLPLVALLDGVDAVVHLAARPGVRPSFDTPAEYAEANVTGTTSLLDVMSSRGIPRLVFMSSSSVYGEGAKTPFRESGELGVPQSPYAATKVAGELLCRAFAHRLPSVVILRLFSVYGPRQRPDLAIHKFASCIYGGEAIPVYGSTESFRDYTFVDDAVDAIVAALGVDESWTVLNIGSGKPVTLEQMIQSLEVALGARAKRRIMPPHRGDLWGTWADIGAAERVIAYKPKWPFDAGIRQFADWFLEDESHREAEMRHGQPA